MFVWSDTRLYIRPVSWTCQHFAAYVWANRLSFFFISTVYFITFFSRFNCVTPLWSLAWSCGARISHRAPQWPKKEMLSDSSDPPLLYLCWISGSESPARSPVIKPKFIVLQKEKENNGESWLHRDSVDLSVCPKWALFSHNEAWVLPCYLLPLAS